jgi:hypothetical protein
MNMFKQNYICTRMCIFVRDMDTMWYKLVDEEVLEICTCKIQNSCWLLWFNTG